jgi:7-carboxy-7-deazaguanine synthase
MHRMSWNVLETLRPRDAVKFVVASEADYRWAADVIRTRRLAEKTEVLLSPVHGDLEPRDLVSWILRDRLQVRVNLQIHKYIWSPDTRGV